MARDNFSHLDSFYNRNCRGVTNYDPQLVMRQLDYDQLAVQVTGEMGCSNLLTIEVLFIREGI